MKKIEVGWTLVQIFIILIIVTAATHLYSGRILKVEIEDTFPGDIPDGFLSPGEKVSLNIKAVLDFVPHESYLICDTEGMNIENGKILFSNSGNDSFSNDILKPVIFIKDDCPTDKVIPLGLIYRNDSVADTLSLIVHTVSKIDSCYVDSKMVKCNSNIELRVAAHATDGFSSGYSGMVLQIRDGTGSLLNEVELFDDGSHSDQDRGDGIFANKWWTPATFGNYSVDIVLKDSVMEHSFIKRNITGFTSEEFSLSEPFVFVGNYYPGGPESEMFNQFTQLMDSLERGYNVWNIWFRGEPNTDEIMLWGAKRVVVLWVAKHGGTLKQSVKEKALIRDYLNEGGNLFLATSYLGNYIKEYGSDADSVFYRDILCSDFQGSLSSEDSIQTLILKNPFTGINMDTFHINLNISDSDGFISYADVIVPVMPARSIVNLVSKEDSTLDIDTTICFGVKIEKDNYKMIYLSFDLSDIEPLAVRRKFFEENLKWLSSETTDTLYASSPAEEKIEFVQLSNPYPNPFLKESTIPFTLIEPGYVDLVICDLSGRIIKRLINSSLDKGNFYAVWDGRNEKGDETSVGYYFVRLTMETKRKSDKESVQIMVSKKLLKLRK